MNFSLPNLRWCKFLQHLMAWCSFLFHFQYTKRLRFIELKISSAHACLLAHRSALIITNKNITDCKHSMSIKLYLSRFAAFLLAGFVLRFRLPNVLRIKRNLFNIDNIIWKKKRIFKFWMKKKNTHIIRHKRKITE